MQLVLVSKDGLHFQAGSAAFIKPFPEGKSPPVWTSTVQWNEQDLTYLCVSEDGETTQGFTLSQEEIDEAIAYQDPPLPPKVPYEVGAAQIRAAMLASGFAETEEALNVMVEGIINSTVPAGIEREIALVLWYKATQFKRDYPLILAAQQALNKTDEEVDDLFRFAETF